VQTQYYVEKLKTQCSDAAILLSLKN